MRFNMMDFEAEPTRESPAKQYARPGGIVTTAEAVKPAYEVRDPQDWKLLAAIYGDGRPPVGLPLGVTVNRIPRLIAEARGEVAASRAPVGGPQGQFFRDPQSRMWAWDNYHELYREVVYK